MWQKNKNMIKIEKIEKFILELFQKIGCSEADSKTVSKVLLKAELRGIPSHGLLRIIDYVSLLEKGRINVSPKIKIERETLSTAVVNGDKALGMIAGTYAMNLAIEKAKNSGTGWVACSNSNHFGIAGYYAMIALEHEMVGITMTNASPLVAPTFSISKMLGSNPLAFAIPAGKQPPFVADFATTPIAVGKLNIMAKKGLECPTGWVQDKFGKPSSDPDILKKDGALLTLGSDYEHGSHKGFCMSSVVDIFSGVFSGANFGPFVPPSVPYIPESSQKTGLGTGHFFGAMRIDAFQEASEFKARMDKWIESFRNAENAADKPKVVIPGDPERENEKRILEQGIDVHPKILEDVKFLVKKFELQNNF